MTYIITKLLSTHLAQGVQEKRAKDTKPSNKVRKEKISEPSLCSYTTQERANPPPMIVKSKVYEFCL